MHEFCFALLDLWIEGFMSALISGFLNAWMSLLGFRVWRLGFFDLGNPHTKPIILDLEYTNLLKSIEGEFQHTFQTHYFEQFENLQFRKWKCVSHTF